MNTVAIATPLASSAAVLISRATSSARVIRGGTKIATIASQQSSATSVLIVRL
jgi:hypothetical protein